MNFTMFHCCVFIAVTTVVMIGTLPVNVDAKKVTKGGAYKGGTKGGKGSAYTGGTKGGKGGTRVGTKVGTQEGKTGLGAVYSRCRDHNFCSNTAFHKCDLKTFSRRCPEKEVFDLRDRLLTGTLPQALQSFTNLKKLCVETGTPGGTV